MAGVVSEPLEEPDLGLALECWRVHFLDMEWDPCGEVIASCTHPTVSVVTEVDLAVATILYILLETIIEANFRIMIPISQTITTTMAPETMETIKLMTLTIAMQEIVATITMVEQTIIMVTTMIETTMETMIMV